MSPRASRSGVESRVDLPGLALFLLAVTLVISGLLFLPWPWCSVAILGFVVLNFASHAAIHRELVSGTTLPARLATETLLLIGYALHFTAYQYIVVAHLQHHSEGRTQEYGAPDVTEGEPTLFERLRFYVYLLFVPHAYWTARALVGSLATPLRRELMSGSERARFIYPIAASELLVVAIVVLAALHSVGMLLLYWFATCIIWNILQNVAHYGLTGDDDETTKLASRTYIVEPLFRFLTFGSLAHLPHHVDMRTPGRELHLPQAINATEQSVGGRIRITRGILPYLRDVIRQFRGPMARSRLSTDWVIK